MLRLIVAHGNNSRLVKQNIGSHEDGVLKQAIANGFLLFRFCFELRHALSQPRGVTQVSIQASSACSATADWTMTEDRSGSIPAATKSAAVSRILLAQFFWILIESDGVQVNDTENTLVISLISAQFLRAPK